MGGKGPVLTGRGGGSEPHSDWSPFSALRPCRRQCSACRSWPHPHCSSSLCGTALSPHWSAVPLRGSTWGGCCTSCSVPGTSPLLSTTKGMTDFCRPLILTFPYLSLLCRTCGILNKSLGPSAILVNVIFGMVGGELSKEQKVALM